MQPSEVAPSLAIITAIGEERAAVQAALRKLTEGQWKHVRLIQAGVGAAAAEAAKRELDAHPSVRLLCSAGFCGGLASALLPGAVVLAGHVVGSPTAPAGREEKAHAPARHASTHHAPPLASVAAALRAAGLVCHQGAICSVTQPVFRGSEKRALGQATGALAVDLESLALARLAAERGLAFLALRAVSDSVEDDLPPEVAGFLNPQGKVRPGPVVRYALSGLGSLKQLARLREHAAAASRALTAAWCAAVPVLLKEPGTEHKE